MTAWLVICINYTDYTIFLNHNFHSPACLHDNLIFIIHNYSCKSRSSILFFYIHYVPRVRLNIKPPTYLLLKQTIFLHMFLVAFGLLLHVLFHTQVMFIFNNGFFVKSSQSLFCVLLNLHNRILYFFIRSGFIFTTFFLISQWNAHALVHVFNVFFIFEILIFRTIPHEIIILVISRCK